MSTASAHATTRSADIAPGPISRAIATAKHTHKTVALPQATTADSTTVVNPTGTLTTTLTSGPTRLKRAGRWIALDPTLRRNADGAVTPRSAPESLSVSGGTGTLAQTPSSSGRSTAPLVTLGHGTQKVTIGWKGHLPSPELHGTRATYRSVGPGYDLRIEATRTGFEQFVDLNKRPGAGFSYTLPVDTGKLKASVSKGGQVQFADAAGRVKAALAAPRMWDTHTNKAGVHDHTAPVTVRATNSRPGHVDLVYTPDAAFLAAPSTRYPVTVDPSTQNLGNLVDTYAQQGESGDKSGETELDFGNPGTTNADGTARTARSLIAWNTKPFANAVVESAQLSLWNFHSAATDGHGHPWDVYATSSFDHTANWAKQPSWLQSFVTSYSTLGNPPYNDAGWIHADVTNLVSYWSGQQATTGYMGLRATDDNTMSWKRVNSSEAASNPPTLKVTWDFRPGNVHDLKVGPSATQTNGIWQVNSLTPTLQATIDDGDNDKVDGTFVIEDTASPGTTVGGPLVSSFAAAGTPVSVQVPANLLKDGHTYRFRASGYDGDLYQTDWSDWAQFHVTAAPTGGHAVDLTLPDSNAAASVNLKDQAPDNQSHPPYDPGISSLRKSAPQLAGPQQQPKCTPSSDGGKDCAWFEYPAKKTGATDPHLAKPQAAADWCSPNIPDNYTWPCATRRAPTHC
ncbi:DNRLRE domain-containing protein [Mangrovactinospora gilvigrisea]|uniref:DNRLRE domain-containing protein n=1 Tax=Mangrovactinospora gilvigrisea TaxID=1428644 RepID=UPI001114FEDF|nr:DNRLRE domain-containing protein [Mangrovactinospora gilvigrisea]